MKKILLLLLVLCLVFSLTGCGAGTTPEEELPPAKETAVPSPDGVSAEPDPADTAPVPDEIVDNITSENKRYEIAFVTSAGVLKDRSFNQDTWDGIKLYAAGNGLSYKYYQPANGSNSTDSDRYNAIKAAVDGGASIVVCAGLRQEAALKKAAAEFADTMFLFIDGHALSDSEGNALPNVAGISFREEQSGYFAGFAAVMEGFTRLGFCGGGDGLDPACCRYGYGFIQGASDAAEALGVPVKINYSWLHGSDHTGSPELQAMVNRWYANGTEIIFACGGTMVDSVAAAAAENDGFVIGADRDLSAEYDAVITSALKNRSEAVIWALSKFYEDAWADIGGLDSCLDAAAGFIALPTDTWKMENYTVEDYEGMLASLAAGDVIVDAEYPEDITSLNTQLVTITEIK